MRRCRLWSGVILVLASVQLPAAPPAGPSWRERPDWAALFDAAGVPGTLVVVDRRDDRHWVHDHERAQRRYLPASTFKIPHTLFALDADAALTPDSQFAWDGTERSFAAWNRDHSLRSAYAHSAVWVYQELARRIGLARERAYLRRIGYGNADPGGGLTQFWLTGALRISAFEQIGFLQRLYDEALPFDREDQRTVKDIMLLERGDGWTLHAKTGWAFDVEPQIGWYVGWVGRDGGAVFFALNIDMPDGAGDVGKRTQIVRAALASIGALPPAQ
ncbi:class D beta-lactamase [Sinimarinibacterium flocculans]|uniref:Beta-lactamase n=1 Tax=Sinimarinibacterium flocculans TaxID=985250 RepID=A0A318EEZ4_9GAMM|nr:class D beta-lactamase [Sinimarinibacterium flocculans]PXV66579.1 beta-lactamase class D [Sinimarinibacterium flocculans]